MMRRSFFHQKDPVVTSLLPPEDSVEKICARIARSVPSGAGGIAVDLCGLPPEQRTVENYRKMMDEAPELPFMFISYRSDAWLGNDDEKRQEYLLRAIDAGAEVIDVMGDLFDPEPYELAVKPEAIAKQKTLIETIHAQGAKVISSSHMKVPRTAEEVLAHLREQSSRGADILKIVTQVETAEEFVEAVRTTLLLKRELDKPFVHLCNGAYSRLHRFLGPKLGIALTFGVLEEKPTSQPTLEQFRTVLGEIHWREGNPY